MLIRWNVRFILFLTFAAIHSLSINVQDYELPCRIKRPSNKLKRLYKGQFEKPNLCCGIKPFSSKHGLCCMGKVLKKDLFKCCLDGTIVPKDSVCLCHPASSWVKDQIIRVSSLENKLNDIERDLKGIISNLKSPIIQLQEEIETMEKITRDLYEEVIVLVDDSIRVDPYEVDYIVKLIIFLNENENKMNGVKKQMSLLRDTSENTVPQGLRGLRSTMKWSRGLQVLITQEIQVNLRDEGNVKTMKKLVLKREKILEKISDRKLILGRFNNHLKNVRSALSIINNDIKLMEHLHGILDNKLTLVIQMENTFAEETKMLNFSFSTTEILAMTNETQNSFTSEYLKILLRNSLDEKARKKMNEIEYKADEDFESLLLKLLAFITVISLLGNFF